MQVTKIVYLLAVLAISIGYAYSMEKEEATIKVAVVNKQTDSAGFMYQLKEAKKSMVPVQPGQATTYVTLTGTKDMLSLVTQGGFYEIALHEGNLVTFITYPWQAKSTIYPASYNIEPIESKIKFTPIFLPVKSVGERFLATISPDGSVTFATRLGPLPQK